MSNNGINEQLLEDIKEIVKVPDKYRWRKMDDEQPDPKIHEHILVFFSDWNSMHNLIYDNTNDMWFNLAKDSSVNLEHLTYWRPIDFPPCKTFGIR